MDHNKQQLKKHIKRTPNAMEIVRSVALGKKTSQSNIDSMHICISFYLSVLSKGAEEFTF